MSNTSNKIGSFLRDNPILPFAITGLLAGLLTRFAFNQTATADVIWLIVLVIGGAPTVWRTLNKMRHGDFASDVVAMLAIITAIIMREYFSGLIIVIMQTGGEALENYSLHRASSSLEGLLARAPRIAFRKQADQLTQIEVSEVQIGDTLVVRTGDLIPVDGVLQSDQASIDESALTGEPVARGKTHGAVLLSGSVNNGSSFDMTASKPAQESKYAQIVALVRKAQEDKPPLQRLADRYAVWFTPVTLIMCALGWLITQNPTTILAVLVVATPCPLILAVPVAVIGGINRAAAAGIVVKTGTAIEQIGRVQAVLFDKTGTLTYGTPMVEQIVALNGFSENDLLHLAGSTEQLSAHTLAGALTAAAQQRAPLALPTDFQEQAGYGVQAVVDNHRVAVGSRQYIASIDSQSASGNGTRAQNDHLFPADLASAELATYVGIDGKAAGVITFQDQVRPGAAALMTTLKMLHVQHTVMVTGDNEAHARAVAAVVGVDAVQAGLLPEDKVRVVSELSKQYGFVAMVGDGINDAPALATATVGIAMGAHGTGISAEAADIVLLVDDITRVATAIAAGQHMTRIAKQSIFIGLGLSFGCMILAALGFIQPAIGAILQEVIDVAVILNALRAR